MKNPIKRQWPLLGVGILILGVAFFLLKPDTEVAQEPAGNDKVMTEEGLKLEDIHYTQEDDEKGLKWILDAKEVTFSDDRRFIQFNSFRLEVEPKDKPCFRLRGNRGDYSRDSGKMNLWGDVEGTSGDKYRIRTEYILINEKGQDLRTDRPVFITGPFFEVKGRGLFIDLKKETFKVLSDVETTVGRESLI
jgi:LPS export ABC transporter protein LptC